MATRAHLEITLATVREIAPDLLPALESAVAIAGVEMAHAAALRRDAYAPVAAANERVRAATRAYQTACLDWTLGDAPALARRERARGELDTAKRAASLALATYKGRSVPK